MSDFSDRPFVAGSLTGLRSFAVDQYGRLMATQLNVVWLPDENDARCLRSLFDAPSGYFTHTMNQLLYGGGPAWIAPTLATLSIPKAEPKAPKPSSEHRAGTQSCSCGFYAYFDDGANPYHKTGQVRGLIEGYGVTTVGTRGFRSEKAKVRALIIPPKKATALTDRVRANYASVPVFDSRRDALAAFPLTPPAQPTPDTDADFWTRETL